MTIHGLQSCEKKMQVKVKAINPQNFEESACYTIPPNFGDSTPNGSKLTGNAITVILKKFYLDHNLGSHGHSHWKGLNTLPLCMFTRNRMSIHKVFWDIILMVIPEKFDLGPQSQGLYIQKIQRFALVWLVDQITWPCLKALLRYHIIKVETDGCRNVTLTLKVKVTIANPENVWRGW